MKGGAYIWYLKYLTNLVFVILCVKEKYFILNLFYSCSPSIPVSYPEGLCKESVCPLVVLADRKPSSQW